MKADMLEVARRAVELARGKGAQEAAAAAWRARHVEVAFRDGKLEKVTEATTRGLGVDLYVDGRYASLSTNDLRPEALDRFVSEAAVLTRKLAPDPFRSLPDPELYRGQAELDLDLFDPGAGALEMTARERTAQAMEAAARSAPGSEVILSCTAGFGDTASERWQVHSNGFEGFRRATDFGMSCEVSVRDPDGRRPEDWDAASARHLSDLPAPEALGRGAADRALARLGSGKGESAVLPMAVDRRAAGRLLASLVGPLSAAALQQKRSFFDGKMGQRIGSDLLDIGDDPLVVRGLGSRLFDGEGLAARPFPVFERGTLRTCYVDTYYGRKLGMTPTTGRASNLRWRLGQADRAGLVKGMGDGILVTGFLGGNSNGTTGDFSLGVQGFRVRGGELREPISEMNVSGTHLDLWQRLAAVGNDPYPYSQLRTPTLVFDAVQFAGL